MTADDLAFEALRELSTLRHFPAQIVDSAVCMVMKQHRIEDLQLFIDARNRVVDALSHTRFVVH